MWYNSKQNMRDALDVLDGKHIAIRCTRGGGNKYFNHKVAAH